MAATVDEGPAVPQTRPVAVRSSAAHRGLNVALAAMRLGPVMILVLLVAVLSVASDVFLSFENVGNVLKQSAVVCVLALGQLLVILTRGIDLSVGANLSLSAVVGAIVWRDHGSATLAILAALATGSLVGVVNGVIYVKGRLPHPFIPTLAMLSAASGLALLLAHNETIQGAPPIVNTMGTGRISWIPGGGDIGWFPFSQVPDRPWASPASAPRPTTNGCGRSSPTNTPTSCTSTWCTAVSAACCRRSSAGSTFRTRLSPSG
jgi:ribose transport system permease protein